MTDSDASEFCVLLFFIVDPKPHTADDVAQLIESLKAAVDWAISPPVFVDAIDDRGSLPLDKPVRTLGGYMLLHRPTDGTLTAEIDRQEFRQTRELFRRLANFSSEKGYTIGVEYDGEEIGEIENGVVDHQLQTGLLDEWERHLTDGSP